MTEIRILSPCLVHSCVRAGWRSWSEVVVDGRRDGRRTLAARPHARDQPSDPIHIDKPEPLSSLLGCLRNALRVQPPSWHSVHARPGPASDSGSEPAHPTVARTTSASPSLRLNAFLPLAPRRPTCWFAAPELEQGHFPGDPIATALRLHRACSSSRPDPAR